MTHVWLSQVYPIDPIRTLFPPGVPNEHAIRLTANYFRRGAALSVDYGGSYSPNFPQTFYVGFRGRPGRFGGSTCRGTIQSGALPVASVITCIAVI